jgi:splicing factor 3B subunit 4
VASVHIPRDKVTGRPSGFGFVEMATERDADYALLVAPLLPLYNKPIRANKAAADKNKLIDVGANLFIGNLEAGVDEKVLYDTFSSFGVLTAFPKVMRGEGKAGDAWSSKGYGFVSFDSFEAADLAIECMNGRYLGGRQIVAQYAFKNGSKTERHGSAAERAMAAANRKAPTQKPNMLFASAPGQVNSVVPAAPLPMVGSKPAPPPMLPPTAILPMSMSVPQMQGGGGMMMPPPLPGSGLLPSPTGMPLPPPLPAAAQVPRTGPLLPGGPGPMPPPLPGFGGAPGFPGGGFPGGFPGFPGGGGFPGMMPGMMGGMGGMGGMPPGMGGMGMPGMHGMGGMGGMHPGMMPHGAFPMQR